MRKNIFTKCIGSLGFMILLCAVIVCSLPVSVAYADNTVSLATDIQNEPPATKLNLKNVSIVKGKTYALKIYNLPAERSVVFKSDNTAVATVSEDGVITAVDYGEAVITAYIKNPNNKTLDKLTCDVLVGPAAISVKFTKSKITLAVGRKTMMNTIVQPLNTVEKVKFVSLNSDIATISPGGCITARSEGTTKIYTMIDNGKYDICTVTVVSEEAYSALISIIQNDDINSSSETNSDSVNEQK